VEEGFASQNVLFLKGNYLISMVGGEECQREIIADCLKAGAKQVERAV